MLMVSLNQIIIIIIINHSWVKRMLVQILLSRLTGTCNKDRVVFHLNFQKNFKMDYTKI